MTRTLITNAQLVNEGQVQVQDIAIAQGRIEKIAASITPTATDQVIDAAGKYLLPGMIDDQVHFREPGLTHKGSIASESRAAVAGGITSYMEMPNVNPTTSTQAALEDKWARAAQGSVANYSFYMGATHDNLEEIKRIDPQKVCGVKIFMGASTGNMLVDDPEILAAVFANSPVLIVTHCEDTPMIKANEESYLAKYGPEVPMQAHPLIRSREACYASSSLAVELARQNDARLHVLHLTTAEELALFPKIDDISQLYQAPLTGEVCVHHLFFNSDDYPRLGTQIKCNPAIKAPSDQAALLAALKDNTLAVIATDHAPHTWDEKQNTYFAAPAGVPLVQHALLSVLEFYHRDQLTLPEIVSKTSHAVAERYGVQERGYLREGYYADLVLVDLAAPFTVTKESLLYHCGWSPFTGYQFNSSIHSTWVNGQQVFDGRQATTEAYGQALQFAIA